MRQNLIYHDGPVRVCDSDLRASWRSAHHLALRPSGRVTLPIGRAGKHQRMPATVGSGCVAREAPDGHTVLAATISSLTAPFMMNPRPYDPVRDFRALSLLAITPTVLVVRPDFPARTVQEWHQVIQRNPGRFTFASGGVGNPAHLAGELYRSMTGANITHVAFRGSAPALVELRAGRVDFSILDLPSAAAMIAERTIPALAVGTAEPDAAADALLAAGVSLAIVKLGADGVLLATSADRWRIPPIPIDVVCGLGAGDAFGGALCHGLLSGWDIPHIGRFANAAGALVSTRLTCADAMPTVGELESMLGGAA